MRRAPTNVEAYQPVIDVHGDFAIVRHVFVVRFADQPEINFPVIYHHMEAAQAVIQYLSLKVCNRAQAVIKFFCRRILQHNSAAFFIKIGQGKGITCKIIKE